MGAGTNINLEKSDLKGQITVNALMILDSEPWFISIEPRTCFHLTKSMQKNIKVLGKQGMYPWFLCFPDRHRLRVGAGAGASAGEKRMTVHDDRDVGFDKLDVGGDSQRFLWKWWDFHQQNSIHLACLVPEVLILSYLSEFSFSHNDI